jgi:EAL domain-containing protein (putative c-di-GMP-specific phosphodiesterase class I)
MIAAPAVSVALLIGVVILRFEVDTDGIMLFAVVPIVLLAILFGRPGGLAASLFASAAFVIWSITDGRVGTLEQINQPLTFLVLGFVAGTWAHGALGNYDPESAVTIWRLRTATRRGWLVMHYQPIVGTQDGSVVALEALARWIEPNRGTVLPGAFIPQVEGSEQAIWALTLHTLNTAAADARAWTDERFQIGINISPVILQRRELPRAISEILRNHAIAPERLALEVTERVVAEEDSKLIAAIERLRDVGVSTIAIDDFGVGQSSLARLDRLPIDILKIDRALVERTEHDETRAIVAAITEMGHALRLRVVGEGVEDAATQERLADMGCDAVQGFAIARPLPPEHVGEWLGSHGVQVKR